MSSGSVRRVQARRRTLVLGSKVTPFYVRGPVFLSPRPHDEVLKMAKSFSEGQQQNTTRFSDSSILETEEGPVWGPRQGPGRVSRWRQGDHAKGNSLRLTFTCFH